eukprot:s4313_g4.t1
MCSTWSFTAGVDVCDVGVVGGFRRDAEARGGVGLVINIRQAKTRRVWANQFVIIRHSDADVANVKMDEAAGGVLRTVQVTAASLGSQVDRGGLTAAETLEDPQEVAKAARWRTGDSVRRMTSVLARISQVLKSFVESPAQAQQPGSVPAPVRPLPLRGHHDQPGPAAAVLHAGSVLDYSLLARALEMGSGNHVWMQATLAAMEIESNVATWLYEQLGFVVQLFAVDMCDCLN